jgi:hypothetical protein
MLLPLSVRSLLRLLLLLKPGNVVLLLRKRRKFPPDRIR